MRRIGKEWSGKIAARLGEKRAETLFELVVSMALFGMMVLMVASMFGMADKVSMKNLQTDQTMDQNITDIVTEQNLEAEETQTIVFQDDEGRVRSVQVERIKAGGLYKFRTK